MASKRKAFLSRSVSLSLAALIVLTGAMFLITTLEQDHQVWVLVEDEVIVDGGVYSNVNMPAGDSAEYVFDFDDETATYTLEVTGGSKASSVTDNIVHFAVTDDFDYSKNYKFVINSSDLSMAYFFYNSSGATSNSLNLRNVSVGDDGYNAEIILLDQFITDLSFKDYFCLNLYGSKSATFSSNTLTLQLYELQDDNAGSVAAAITGLTLIVMGVFATPMLNVFRRR